MTTLAVMVARIQDELARSDLESQVRYAISDAIAAYSDREFHFNDSRITFSTVAGQEFYDADDAAALGTIEKIHYVKHYISDVACTLNPMTPDAIESAATVSTNGDPIAYCWYAGAFRLYPIPVAVSTVRIGATVAIAAPASDAATGNFWMTDGERLIRCRAKFELFTHVIHNSDKAQEMWQLAEEALSQLKRRQNKHARGDGRVEAMEF